MGDLQQQSFGDKNYCKPCWNKHLDEMMMDKIIRKNLEDAKQHIPPNAPPWNSHFFDGDCTFCQKKTDVFTMCYL